MWCVDCPLVAGLFLRCRLNMFIFMNLTELEHYVSSSRSQSKNNNKIFLASVTIFDTTGTHQHTKNVFDCFLTVLNGLA